MAILQSDTQWIKKGQKLSDGTIAAKGYLASKTNDKKKITGAVAISTATKRAAAGTTSTYKAGRAGVAAKPTAARKPSATLTPAQKKAAAVKSASAMTSRERSMRAGAGATPAKLGTGLRGTASLRGKYGTGSGSTKQVGPAAKPSSTPTPKGPMTAAERNKATGGVNAYGMMGGSEGTVRTQRNKSKTGVLAPEFSLTSGGRNKAALQAFVDRRAREAAEEKKKSSPKIGETKRVSAGVGYVQIQKYTSKGWVNVGPKRRSK